jgi:hypothetical protein
LNLIYICLSLAALGLVSLVGCEVQKASHLTTDEETIQVPPLPELSSRPSVAVSLSVLRHLYRGILLNLAYS